MSQENVEIAREVFAGAFARWDLDGALQLIDAECVMDWSASVAPYRTSTTVTRIFALSPLSCHSKSGASPARAASAPSRFERFKSATITSSFSCDIALSSEPAGRGSPTVEWFDSVAAPLRP